MHYTFRQIIFTFAHHLSSPFLPICFNFLPQKKQNPTAKKTVLWNLKICPQFWLFGVAGAELVWRWRVGRFVLRQLREGLAQGYPGWRCCAPQDAGCQCLCLLPYVCFRCVECSFHVGVFGWKRCMLCADVLPWPLLIAVYSLSVC